MSTPKTEGSLALRDLRHANTVRQGIWPGAEHVDLPYRVIEVAGECGEMAEAFKKLTRAWRGIKGTTAGQTALEDEIAYVIIAVDLLAADLGIDLAKVVSRKFNKTSAKYDLPVQLDEHGSITGDF